jgi:ribosomal protein L9
LACVGFGFKGDVVKVSKRLARNHMLPVGVAEYVSPENLAKYAQTREVSCSRIVAEEML